MAFHKQALVFAVIGIAAAAGVAWWLRPAALPAGPAAVKQEPAGDSGGAPAVSVEAVAVRQMALRDEAQAVGSLRSRQSVMLRPEVGGRVTQINFRDGQRVRRGQLLVQFDDSLPRAQLRQDQAELSLAQANQRRNQELFAQGFVSQRAVEEGAAKLEVAQARLALTQTNVERLKLVAPFDGVAGIGNLSVGDYLKDGADIVNLEDLDALYVDFRLPERWQARLRAGQQALVAFDALAGARYAALVQAISPQIDADGRAIALRGCIDNRRLQLRPGMFARVSVLLAERSAARVLPEQAIVPDGSGFYVLRIVAGAQAGSLVSRRTAVTLGARMAGLVEVTDGLDPGDRVVSAGQQRVRNDGAELRVLDAPPAPATAAQDAAAASATVAPLPGRNPCQAANDANVADSANNAKRAAGHATR